MDYQALDEEKQKLNRLAQEAIPQELARREDLAEEIIRIFVNLTPPESPPTIMENITISSGGLRGGYSRKPGNLVMNWEKLLKLVPDLVISLVGFSGPVWLIPFVGLHVWSTLWSESKVELDPNHAMALLAMWQNKDEKNKISEQDAFTAVNRYLSESGMRTITDRQFAAVIDQLAALDCVKLEEGVIWLREWVNTSYT